MALDNSSKSSERFGKRLLDFKCHKDWVLSAAISHDGQWVVSGSEDGIVRFWDKHGRAQLTLQGHQHYGACLCYKSFDMI